MSDLDNDLLGNPLTASSVEKTGDPVVMYDEATDQYVTPAYYGVETGDDGHFYNENGERVYYWVESGEQGGHKFNQDTADQRNKKRLREKGGFYTEAEIKKAWNDGSMGTLKSQMGNNWDNYWGYISERQGLIETGQIRTGLDAWQDGRDKNKEMLKAGGGLRAMGGAKAGSKAMQQVRMEGYYESFNTINDDPLQVALMEKYGIPRVYQADNGSLYEFNGSSYTMTYKSQGGLDIGAIVKGMIVGVATAGIGGVLGG